MSLQDLGFGDKIQQYISDDEFSDFEIARVIAEHKERYIIKTSEAELDAEITGNMRFTAETREDFPAVGDWVAVKTFDELAIIHKILPRYSVIKRQAVGHFGEIQLIAANIDSAFIVQAVDRDFNINRLERYLTICHSARVNPVIVLTKTDLTDESTISDITESIKSRIEAVPVIAISNETKAGYDDIMNMIEKGKTYCLLGSSGVGKSTLINNLSGKSLMQTGSISQSTNKGRHVTSHRELVVLDKGGILIDNPGMREVGIADTENGLEITFDKIEEFAADCKYADCTHTNESGCAVIAAVNEGLIDNASYENYLKMEKEKSHFESSAAERKKKDKALGKIVKNYKKNFNKKR